MPIGDWQFWVVTTIAVVAVAVLVRTVVLPMLPGRRMARKKVGLTVEGRSAKR